MKAWLSWAADQCRRPSNTQPPVALVRSGGTQTFSDDIKYLEQQVHKVLADKNEVLLAQSVPRGNLSAHPRNAALVDACANTVVAVLRLTGTLI